MIYAHRVAASWSWHYASVLVHGRNWHRCNK